MSVREISEASPVTWLLVGVYRKANTKWSPLLPQCEQRTRGAIRSSGRGIPGTRVALFSGPVHSLPTNERNSIRGRFPIQVHLAFELARPRNRIWLFGSRNVLARCPTEGFNALMSDHIYKKIELVGSSPNGIEDAVNNAITRAGKTIRNMSWFEVAEVRGSLENNKVAHSQVTVKVGFTLDS